MKLRNYIIPLLLAAFALGGCSDDTFVSTAQQMGELDESDLIEAFLSLSVNDFTVSTYTRVEERSEDTEIASDWENWIDNVWVFQYDESGNLLIYPRYYTLTDQSQVTNLKVVLKPVASQIYVVTNVNHSNWVADYTQFSTVNNLLMTKLAEPEPLIDLTDNSVEGHIPMQGCSELVNVSDKITIEVPVERMYAKVKLRVIFDRDIEFHEPSVSNVEFGNIPWYCRIGTLYDGVDSRSKDNSYPTGDTYDWIERDIAEANNTNDPNEKLRSADEVTYDYVIYLPENIQGEVSDNLDLDAKANVAPSHATWVGADIEYTSSEGVDSHKTFTVYPGGNQYNNYNIRRNQVYRVTLNIGEFEEEYTPSANCIVISTGKKGSFLPYYRVEEGGGYDFSDYLDPEDPEKTINGVKILWQTENCIGDNSAGDLVYFEPSNPQTIYDKIYVSTNADGNALIAAYNDAECEGDILWSWHIWVTSEDPGNVGNAITYYTYDWDENGIYGEESGRARVPGYGVMPCNVGAIHTLPLNSNADRVLTFGMAYQWGRKDPFPPAYNAGQNRNNKGNGTEADYYQYTEESIKQLYDNSHNYITGMTADTDEKKLFHSVTGTTIESQGLGMDFAIKNPTVFMCGTYDAATDNVDSDVCKSYVRTMGNYHNHGDWMADGLSDDRLWGSVGQASATKSLELDEDSSGDTRHIYDDYGTKSIFDPCPYGWRVSPPDQWLGFTLTGQNPDSNGDMSDINYYDDGNVGYGMYLYMQEWQRGLTSYFPVQGMRAPNGAGSKVRTCGNYHNATTDESNIVNILHIHNQAKYFKIFEYEYVDYYVKSTGGPVRCVRDSK